MERNKIIQLQILETQHVEASREICRLLAEKIMSLSKHLNLDELASKDGTQHPDLGWATALASEFEALREAFGDKPLKVSSGYRSSGDNTRVGGAGHSQHLDGKALDFIPPNDIDWPEIEKIVLDQARRRGLINGVGFYRNDGHVHIDLRQGPLVMWNS